MDRVKPNYRDKMLMLSGIIIVLVTITPLHYSLFYVVCAWMLILICLNRRNLKFKVTKLKNVFLLALSLFLYLLLTPDLLVTSYWKSAIVACIIIINFYLFFPGYRNYKEMIIIKDNMTYELLYWVLYIYDFGQVVWYAIRTRTELWKFFISERSYNTLFPFGEHYVDFSIILIFIFSFGMKRTHYMSTFFLSILTWFVLPSRTYKLYIILFVLCSLGKGAIYKALKKIWKYKWFLFITLITMGILIFSYVWVEILNEFLIIAESHGGIYDASNYERFLTILNAASIIVKKHLFVQGLSVTTEDFAQLNGYSNIAMVNGPHNSYYSLILYFGILLAGAIIYILIKILDDVTIAGNVSYIIPYILTASILHDMFVGYRLIMFIMIVLMPIKLCKYKYIINLTYIFNNYVCKK